MTQIIYSVSGIHCEACVKLITKRIGKIQGVTDVSVDMSGQTTIAANRQIEKDEITSVLEGTEYSLN